MLILTTIGFDEKFIVRSLLRNKVGRGDKMVVFLFEGYEENDKVMNALKSVKNILENVIFDEDFVVEKLPKSDEIDVFLRIRKAILSNLTGDRQILAILSGGMRPLLITILMALFKTDDAKIIIESEYENFEGHVVYDMSPFKAERNEKWINIIECLMEGDSLRGISRRTGLSLASISRELQRMMKYNLVRPQRSLSRITGYEVTDSGKIYLRLYKDSGVKE
ncbi:MAG: CRISPR-associated transcriptional regulator Csa3 [Thermoplasmata archaeon]|nr:MAG: CRISPR-associated transcriptional regulator Csa3 [Thermoplasmata archaeon]